MSLYLGKTNNLTFNIVASSYGWTHVVSSTSVTQESSIVGFEKISSGMKSYLASQGVTIPTDGVLSSSKSGTVSLVTANSGTASETKTWTISTSIPYNKDTVVATMRISSDSSVPPYSVRRILKTPNLLIDPIFNNTNIKKNVKTKLVLTSTTTSTKGDITTYVFNVVCKIKSKINSSVGLSYNLKHSLADILSATKEIKSITLSGGTTVNKGGEIKDIRVYGVPDTSFEMSIVDSNNTTILDSSLYSAVAGATPVISTTIPNKGYYSFSQKFPRLPLIRKTAINGSMAASGATTIIFDSLTDVLVGDQLFGPNIPPSSVVVVTVLNPSGSNANECTVSQSVTAADDAVVEFRRSENYDLKITSNDNLGSLIPTTFPTYTFNQYRDVALTIKIYSEAAGSWHLKQLQTSGSYTTLVGGSGATKFHETYYGGRADTLATDIPTGNVKNSFNINYTLDGVSSKEFTLDRQPSFVQTGTYTAGSSSSVTDFSNSDPANNGGMDIGVSNLTAVTSADGGYAAGLLTINADIAVNKWGTQDVTMVFNVDNFIN